ncbi:MAG TPA: hypothetical protein PKM63_05630 [Panacibacter sp.]|nr:hypothetical protein [Panacibacter sp.]HNP43744.1 hypothetical protein [Panacibacter sp.]
MRRPLIPIVKSALVLGIVMISIFLSCKKKNPDPPVNIPPVANAKISRPEAIAGDTITLKGSGTDADGTVTAYLWSQVSGPSSASILNAGSANSIVNGLAEGTYIFQLIVTDNAGASAVDTTSVKIIPPPCNENGEWHGFYGTPGVDILLAPDLSFINGGIAQLNNSPWSYFYSSVQLLIPACRIISADSVRLEVRLKNPSTGLNAITDYDAGLYLEGENDTASAQYIGFRSDFTKFGLTKKNITNSVNLLHVFEDWSTVTLGASNSVLTTTRDGVMTETMSYNGYSVGLLKAISVSFKGPGSIDWIKLYSSGKSNRLLMQEDFDTDGHSNVIWY